MIVRYTCRLGDMTTSGGTVIGDGPHRMSVYGQKAAIEGDSVSCPACHTMGAIRAVGPRLSVRIDGRLIALNDDECECACWPRPRLLSSQTNHKQRIEPNPPRPSAPAASPESPARTKSAPEVHREGPTTAGNGAASSACGHGSSDPGPDTYTQWIRFMDANGQWPLAHRECILRIDGRSSIGRTDALGYLEVRGRSSADFEVHAFFAAPNGSMNAKEEI
jgi:uncharacterized Zn-binding protein involved in type VI secretion